MNFFNAVKVASVSLKLQNFWVCHQWLSWYDVNRAWSGDEIRRLVSEKKPETNRHNRFSSGNNDEN